MTNSSNILYHVVQDQIRRRMPFMAAGNRTCVRGRKQHERPMFMRPVFGGRSFRAKPIRFALCNNRHPKVSISLWMCLCVHLRGLHELHDVIGDNMLERALPPIEKIEKGSAAFQKIVCRRQLI